jgi:hypothetical protein
LDATDGSVPAGGTLVVLRRERPMGLNNDGYEIGFFNASGVEVDREIYESAKVGEIIDF